MRERTRIRIFVDFWNFQLCWNDFHQRQLVKIPWKNVLPSTLIAEACPSKTAKFVGIHVYASVDPSKPKDARLRKWLDGILKGYPGYSVTLKERRPRSRVYCGNAGCRSQIWICPHCNAKLKGTVEKGIDAALITDLLASAFDDTYDLAILISGDADYAPAVEYIQRKTDKQIIQAFFRVHGYKLRNACWSHIFFDDLMPKLVEAVDDG